MRHPFAGIIGLDRGEGAVECTVEGAAESRRTALKVMLAGAGTLASGGLVAVGAAARADDPKADKTDKTNSGDRPVTGHAAYLVVPRDFRAFRADRRQALGVHGDYYRGAPESKNLRGKGGFLAWLTGDEAKKVAAANDVTEVLAVGAEDKPGPGTRRMPTREVRLVVLPGGWKTRPDAATFTPTEKLIQQWSKQFAGAKEVSFKAGENDGVIVAVVGDGEPPKDVLAALKEHPQLVAIEWKYAATAAGGEDGGPTTLAVGEEGGVTTKALGEEGGPSTRALGEEGGSTERVGEEGGVTTKARGEEGGATTLRVGEEGGATTKALGEEGGVSTDALGEEGGSTERLGEEGGATTLALGEEGGPTTLALGEEGGKPKPTPKTPTPKTTTPKTTTPKTTKKG